MMTELTLDEYQERAFETCMSTCANTSYTLGELVEEIGELYGKYNKAIRKGQIVVNGNCHTFNGMTEKEMREFDDAVDKEIGDILWGIATLCYVRNRDLSEIARKNLDKLSERAKNGTIAGSGDGVTKEERL